MSFAIRTFCVDDPESFLFFLVFYCYDKSVPRDSGQDSGVWPQAVDLVWIQCHSIHGVLLSKI